MKARTLTLTALTLAASVVLPAKAADPQLVSLIMPDATVLAGVNVEQAKMTPFGQYVLSQMQSQNQELQKLESLTGFDPTRDVRELLAASNSAGTNQHTGLLVARGSFDPARIAAAATTDGGSTEVYGGVTIVKDPKGEAGFAFLDATLVAAGDIASVKGAIDRRSGSSSLPANVVVLVNQWSSSQDAWAISTVNPASLHPPSTAPKVPGLNANAGGAFQTIQSGAAGVKFGTNVVVTALATADNAQDASSIADSVKLLASLAQLQAQNDPAALALAQSLQVSASGSNVNLSVSLPEDQLQQIVKPKSNNRRPAMRGQR